MKINFEQIIMPRMAVMPERGLFWDRKKEEEKDTGIRIDAGNWSEYLKVTQKTYTGNTLDGRSYTRGVNYILKLKDEYASRLDPDQDSSLVIHTAYRQKLMYAEYKNGQLSTSGEVTADNADQRILDTFHCDTGQAFAQFLQEQEAEVQKEELTLNDRSLINGAAIGWFGLQRYDSSDWRDESIFAYWQAADFAITKLEGVLYLKQQ